MVTPRPRPSARALCITRDNYLCQLGLVVGRFSGRPRAGSYQSQCECCITAVNLNAASNKQGFAAAPQPPHSGARLVGHSEERVLWQTLPRAPLRGRYRKRENGRLDRLSRCCAASRRRDGHAAQMAASGGCIGMQQLQTTCALRESHSQRRALQQGQLRQRVTFLDRERRKAC